jgi:hypothetical protein
MTTEHNLENLTPNTVAYDVAIADMNARARAEHLKSERHLGRAVAEVHAQPGMKDGSATAWDGKTYATPREQMVPGPMAKGVSSGDQRGLVSIGGMLASRESAENMRMTMTPQEWKAATGLEYTSVLTGQALQPHQQGPSPEQQRLDELNAIEQQMAEQAEAERQADEDIVVTPSLLAMALEANVGPEVVNQITAIAAEHGEIDPETAAKHGIEPFMVEEATAHYMDLAEQALLPVNGAVAFMNDFLSPAEQARARAFILNGDIAGFRGLGERARDRAAGMDAQTAKSFFTMEELVRINLKDRGRGTLTVTLPEVGEVSLAAAISQGLISFNGKARDYR